MRLAAVSIALCVAVTALPLDAEVRQVDTAVVPDVVDTDSVTNLVDLNSVVSLADPDAVTNLVSTDDLTSDLKVRDLGDVITELILEIRHIRQELGAAVIAKIKMLNPALGRTVKQSVNKLRKIEKQLSGAAGLNGKFYPKVERLIGKINKEAAAIEKLLESTTGMISPQPAAQITKLAADVSALEALVSKIVGL